MKSLKGVRTTPGEGGGNGGKSIRLCWFAARQVADPSRIRIHHLHGLQLVCLVCDIATDQFDFLTNGGGNGLVCSSPASPIVRVNVSGSGGGNEGGANPVAEVRRLSWNTTYTCYFSTVRFQILGHVRRCMSCRNMSSALPNFRRQSRSIIPTNRRRALAHISTNQMSLSF